MDVTEEELEKKRSELFRSPTAKRQDSSSGKIPPAPQALPPPTLLSTASKQKSEFIDQLNLKDIILEDLNIDMEELNITTDDIDLEGLDDDIGLLKQHKEVAEVLEAGGDLKEFMTDIGDKLQAAEWGTLQDFFNKLDANEGETLYDLFTQVCSCDSVLERLESLLMTFQVDIQNIGSDIKKLQDECLSKEIKINNRKGVEDKLTKFIESINVNKESRGILSRGEINDSYVELLQEFNVKMAYVKSFKDSSGQQAVACQEIEPKLLSLCQKVVAKLRAYLLEHIHECRDLGMLKKNHKLLLKYAYLYQFLFKHAPDVSEEIKSAHSEMTAKLYYYYYRNFINTISKLQFEIANKYDLIGIDEAKMNSIFTGKKVIKNKTSAFSVGERKKFIEELESIDPQVVTLSTTEKKPYEYLFRSMVYYLMESITDEMMFTQDFFLTDMTLNLTNEIFGKTIAMYNENLDQYLANSYDAIGVFIMIVVVHKYKVIMSQRLVSVLDIFFETCYFKLASRLFHILDLNLQSIKSAQASSLTSIDLRPHYITRRYAEFSVSLLYILSFVEVMGDTEFVKRVNVCLARLREEMEKLLIRMADFKHKEWRTKTVFLINNYDLILSIAEEREITSVDVQQFQKLLDIKMADYAQDLLNRSFGRLVTFSKDYEILVKEADSTASNAPSEMEERINKREDEIESLLKEFSNWKSELEKINNAIMDQFSNFKCGMRVLGKIMTDLLEAYTILAKIIRKYFKNLRLNKFFMPETELTYEMKNLFVRY